MEGKKTMYVDALSDADDVSGADGPAFPTWSKHLTSAKATYVLYALFSLFRFKSQTKQLLQNVFDCRCKESFLFSLNVSK